MLVTGYKKDEVKKYVLENNAGDFIFCEQKERLGTGHAVKQAAPYLPDTGKTLVLYADVPLISTASLNKLIKSAQRKKDLNSYFKNHKTKRLWEDYQRRKNEPNKYQRGS